MSDDLRAVIEYRPLSSNWVAKVYEAVSSDDDSIYRDHGDIRRALGVRTRRVCMTHRGARRAAKRMLKRARKALSDPRRRPEVIA